MPDLQPFAVPIGVVIGPAIAFVAQWINGVRQFDIEKLRIEQSLRTARYERLFATYETTLRVSFILNTATVRLIVLSEGQPPELREREVQDLVAQVAGDVQIANVQLLMHSETFLAQRRFEGLMDVFNEVRALERDTRGSDQKHPGVFPQC